MHDVSDRCFRRGPATRPHYTDRHPLKAEKRDRETASCLVTLTDAVYVLFTGVPNAGVEVAKEKLVVPGIPAVLGQVGIGAVHRSAAVKVDAV